MTAPTPMIQSPVSEEEGEDDDAASGNSTNNNNSNDNDREAAVEKFDDEAAVEKFDDEAMEKSGKEAVEADKGDSDDSSKNNGEIEVILKREHFVERRSSSDSDSEFSLGPRPALDKPTPTGD